MRVPRHMPLCQREIPRRKSPDMAGLKLGSSDSVTIHLRGGDDQGGGCLSFNEGVFSRDRIMKIV